RPAVAGGRAVARARGRAPRSAAARRRDDGALHSRAAPARAAGARVAGRVVRCEVGTMASSLEGAASRAGNHPAVEKGARLGYASSGVVHLLLGWLAVQLAWGPSSQDADQTGALGQPAANPAGAVLPGGVGVGLRRLGA